MTMQLLSSKIPFGVSNPKSIPSKTQIPKFYNRIRPCQRTFAVSFATETIVAESWRSIVVMDLDNGTAAAAIGVLGPFLSAFGFLFILRIVMSWYPKLPVEKFPYVVAYAPTEPILAQTRKIIPPVGGVDVTPVVWFGLVSFLNEILVGPQGLLVLISQKI